jgi:hypothetical protein
MNIASAHRSTYYRLQQVYVNSIVWQFWRDMRTELLEKLKRAGRRLTLSGDGQECNSVKFKMGLLQHLDDYGHVF